MTNEELYTQILAMPFYDKVGAYTSICLSEHDINGYKPHKGGIG